MIQFLGSGLGIILFAAACVVWFGGPAIALWLVYRVTHDLRRIASSLERMEERQIQTAVITPLPTTDSPLEILAGRPIVNSMFGR